MGGLEFFNYEPHFHDAHLSYQDRRPPSPWPSRALHRECVAMAFFLDRLAFLADPSLFTCFLFALHKVLDEFIIRDQFIPERTRQWLVRLYETRRLKALERNNDLPPGTCLIKTTATHPDYGLPSQVAISVHNPLMDEALMAARTAIWGTAPGHGLEHGTSATFRNAARYLNGAPP